MPIQGLKEYHEDWKKEVDKEGSSKSFRTFSLNSIY